MVKNTQIHNCGKRPTTSHKISIAYIVPKTNITSKSEYIYKFIYYNWELLTSHLLQDNEMQRHITLGEKAIENQNIMVWT